MNISKIIILITLLIGVASCGTMSGTTSKIYFDSNPRGAEVVVDGNVIGKTPFELVIKNRKEANIVLRYDGYSDYKRYIGKTPSTTAITLDAMAFSPLFVYSFIGVYGLMEPPIFFRKPPDDVIGVPLVLTLSVSPFIVDGIFGGFYKNKKLNNKIVFYDFETGEVSIIDIK